MTFHLDSSRVPADAEKLAYNDIYRAAINLGVEPRVYMQQLEALGWCHFADKAGMYFVKPEPATTTE